VLSTLSEPFFILRAILSREDNCELTDLADYLLEVARVAVVPGVEFGMDGFERLSFATSIENIARAWIGSRNPSLN